MQSRDSGPTESSIGSKHHNHHQLGSPASLSLSLSLSPLRPSVCLRRRTVARNSQHLKTRLNNTITTTTTTRLNWIWEQTNKQANVHYNNNSLAKAALSPQASQRPVPTRAKEPLLWLCFFFFFWLRAAAPAFFFPLSPDWAMTTTTTVVIDDADG